MRLEKPLFIFDLESTGLDPALDRICQIGYAKVSLDFQITARKRLVNPTIPIPADATAIHGITDEMVANEPTFAQVSKSLLEHMDGCDIGGYNVVGYDIELLWEEFNRSGREWDPSKHRIIDALVIWRKMMPRKLWDAVKEFCPENLEKLKEEDLHDAAVDVAQCADVIAAQFMRWPDALATIDDAAAMARRTVNVHGQELERVDHAGALARRADGVVVFTHKKVRGLPVYEQQKYAQWMLKGDFGENTKQHIRRALAMPDAEDAFNRTARNWEDR